ncbi:MAG TPA: DUF6471 domain-containing protein [Bryobacteraceae bacterium]|nr:DUF6471 domain-containing protein [Bryobacteraceae bacterium]
MTAKLDETHWAERAKRLLKAELKLADVTYEDLAAKLTALGVPESKASVASKISRGAFPASFFLAALHVIGRKTIAIEDIQS